MNGTLPAPAVMLQSERMASRSGDMARAFSEPMSIASTAGAAMMAGPVLKPWAMKSRRVTGALWLSWCRIGSSRPSVRGVFLVRMIMTYSKFPNLALLDQRRAAAEDGTARGFHHGSCAAGCAAGGAGDQLVDETVDFSRDHSVDCRI